ncbi:MAG: type II toxin-antitoxin system VapC family toxin [Egibacteraceae bacterium]
MITSVDTSVLLDVFGADRVFGPTSRSTLSDCLATGSVVACAVVWAEVAGFFPSPPAAGDAMDTLGVGYSAMQRDAALAAARSWNAYRQQGGSRQRMVADFLIGAHALRHADQLLTRDRGFYRAYFSDLKILEPG